MPFDCLPAPLGGYKFPEATSASTCFSRERSATSRRQPSVLALQTLHLPGLIDLKAAVLFAPAVVTLLGDLRLPACKGQTLALGRLHLNLTQLEQRPAPRSSSGLAAYPTPLILADPLNQPGPKPAGQVMGGRPADLGQGLEQPDPDPLAAQRTKRL